MVTPVRDELAVLSRSYESQVLERFVSTIPVPVKLSSSAVDLPGEQQQIFMETIDTSLKNEKASPTMFAKALLESNMKKFNVALDYYNQAIVSEPEQTFYYINRGALQAEMIDFISSIESNVQVLTLDDAGATRAKVQEKSSKNYDYSSAIQDMKKAAALAHQPADAVKRGLVDEAMGIRDEDAAKCHAIGRHGATLLKNGQTVLTHCNAGGLATAEYGTALAPVYVAKEQGKTIRVFADETRPLLQGARLTAWELLQEGIDVTLICDNTAAQVMKEGRVDAVLVGSDRIAANGDAANKIGTYGLALAAHAHGVPFYVLAPTTTFDLSIESGDGIPIEHRDGTEVTHGFGRQTAPDGVQVYSPAFDVTPAKLIAAIVCENGIARPPYKESLRKLLG